MPRFPNASTATSAVYKSIFARIADRLASVRGEVFPLHIGDTYLDPVTDGGASLALEGESGALARYAHPHGRPDLVALVRAEVASRGLAGDVQITSGATHALYGGALAVLERGDEVLTLAPYWPLIPGILLTAGARPVEVPFFDRLAAGESIEDLLAPHLTPRTAALYFNSPNNPSGKVLGREHLELLAAFAARHGLWVLADEVYCAFCFDHSPPLIAALPGMAERTLSAFSFSKSHAMAGYRVGYLVGPAGPIEAVRKISTHTVYTVSGLGQLLARRLLERGRAASDRVGESYRRGAEIARLQLRAPFAPAEGGAYVFLDLRSYRDPSAVLAAALDRGVALAPGEAFGPSYSGWARLCYTAVPPEQLARGIAILNEVLAAER